MHPQALRAQALWRQGPQIGDADFDVAARRSAARAAGVAERKEPVDHVADIDIDTGRGRNRLRARLYRPARQARVLLHLHGGGFVFGELETHDAHCRRLANRTGRAVVSVDYRLAPEHVYPAASDDVDQVLDWLSADGVSAELDLTDVAVIGDSAGGHLAAVAAWRHPGLFAKCVLIYPCLSPGNDQPSYRERSGGLTAAEMDWYWDAYAPSQSRREPDLRLAEQDLVRFPSTLVVTAEHDPLVDEGESFAAFLASSGVPVVATRYLGMIHGFYRWSELFDASEQVLQQVAGFLRSEAPSPSVG